MQSKISRPRFSFRSPAVNNGLFAMLSLVGSALSYLLYPVLAKLITPVDFGDISVVIALAGQIGGLLLAFNVVSIYVVNNHEKAHALAITETIQKILIQLLLAATAVVMLVSPWLRGALHIGSVWTILGLGFLLLLNVPAVVWTGFLQGHNELARIGIYNVIVAAAKLVLATVLCLVGLGAPGAIMGILVGQLLGLWAVRFIPGTDLPSTRGVISQVTAQEWATIRPLAAYVGESLVVVGIFSVLFAIDIVLAKSFFSPYTAGIYAGLASLGRVIFFAASILTWIMLANLTSHDLRQSRATMLKYLALIGGGGAVAVGLLAGGADLIVRLSLGAAYGASAGVLWLTGLNQLVASLLYAYTLYLLVLRRGKPAWLAILACGGGIGVAALWHGSTATLLTGLIWGQLAGCVVYAVLLSVRKLTR